jgi:hypothetical protein
MRWHWHGIQRATVSALMLAWLAATALTHAAGAAEAAPPAVAPSDEHNSVILMDPVSELKGSPGSWSVSRTGAGCYLLSPRRTGSSSLAIGRHPKLGLGLFVVSFALSVPKANDGEPVVMLTEGRALNTAGRIVGVQLLFVPLDTADVESSLRELKDNSTLWLRVKHTWIAHGGQGVTAAVAQYGQNCSGRVSG